MSKIHLMILTDVLHSVGGKPIGGAEKQILEFVKALNRDKFKLSVACLSHKDNLLDLIEKEDVAVKRLNIKRVYDWRGITEGLRFSKYLKEQKVDVLMTYHFGSDVWGTIFGKKAGVSCIISNRRDAGFWRKGIHVLTYQLINRWVQKIIAVSEDVKRVVIEEEGEKKEKVQVIYNGLEMDAFNSDQKSEKNEIQLPEDAKVIGCIGNLRPVKGHQYLIEAVKLIAEKEENAVFVLVGMGIQSDLDRLNGLVERLNLKEKIKFLGKRTDVPGLLKIFDVCVLPSLSEGLSNTLLEYMAAGKPIVATSVGGNPEVITDKRTGLLVEKANSKDLAEKIGYLLHNPSEGECLGKNARADVKKRFSMEKMMREYEDLLTNLVEKGHNDT